MSFRFSSVSASSSQDATSSSLRPIKPPKHFQARLSCPQQQFSVPSGPNWIYASGGSRVIRFDFNKALDEQIASEDETCGSSQEYYAHKSASSPSKGAGSFVPPVLPAYNPDPRYLYPTQRPNYTFNFDRATPADIDNMNTALPFGPAPQPECTQKMRKNVDPAPRSALPNPSSFEFGSKTTTFSGHTATLTWAAKTPLRDGPTTLTTRSQNYDEHKRRTSPSKPTRRK